MPGYGFSDWPRERFVSARVPAIWVELMSRLGYQRFAAHGGDIGGGITARLGQEFPERLVGIHVTNVYGSVENGPLRPRPSSVSSNRKGSGNKRKADTSTCNGPGLRPSPTD
jgi:pimeloyl-ACP methyl ester carboxylesterase